MARHFRIFTFVAAIILVVVVCIWLAISFRAHDSASSTIRRSLPDMASPSTSQSHGDDPLSIAQTLPSANPLLISWIQNAQPLLIKGLNPSDVSIQTLDSICRSTKLSFQNWLTLAKSFRRASSVAPILRATIWQASLELSDPATSSARANQIRDAIVDVVKELPEDSENAVARQRAYELLLPNDPANPIRYNTAEYLITEAINLQGKHAEAARRLENLIKTKGDMLPEIERANWEYALGMYLFQDGQYEAAIPHLRAGRKTLRGNHRNESLPYLVLSLVRTNNLVEAQTELQRLQKEYPHNILTQQILVEMSARQQFAQSHPVSR